MPIDVHAHYVPPEMIEDLASRAAGFGIDLKHGPNCQCAIHFKNGAKIRPFFPALVEPLGTRLAAMDATEIDRQVIGSWADIFGPHLDTSAAVRWHRYLNEHLAKLCARAPDRFAMLASVPLPAPSESVRELEHAVKELGAVGAMIPANIAEVNLGDFDLDVFWQAAIDLDVGVFIHPVQAVPSARSAHYGLTQVAQYTNDTTMTAGSLIMTGVLDRFPALRLLLAHGGGTFPYLSGRFDIMHARMDRVQQRDSAARPPSAYLQSFYYDTIVHDPAILRWLVSRVSPQRVLLGSDYSFPPADRDPVGTVRAASLTPEAERAILDGNALRLFPALAR